MSADKPLVERRKSQEKCGWKHRKTDFEGSALQLGDHVIVAPFMPDKAHLNHFTVFEISAISRDHAGPGAHRYSFRAPGYGVEGRYGDQLTKVDLPVSHFP